MNKFEIFFKDKDLDIRKAEDKRFMDQKITPDVLSFIADCILQYPDAERGIKFKEKDIRLSSYLVDQVQRYFGKPDPNQVGTEQEYDKFVGQPLKTLSYAGVLNAERISKTIVYSIKDLDILKEIALNDKNAFLFLYEYLKKFLEDSSMYFYIERFVNQCNSNTITKEDFQLVREKFIKFFHGQTNIKGAYEPPRIFNKIINIFSAHHFIPGPRRGFLSKSPIYYRDLMYNKKNWRDLKKPKNITRKNYEDSFYERDRLKYDENSRKYLSQKAKRFVREFHVDSEVNDQFSKGEATQIHHIFTEHEFPEISHYTENLIKLTPQQHNTCAHPNNKTTVIDLSYQRVCLLAKLNSIKASDSKKNNIYSKEKFIEVLRIGLKIDLDRACSYEEIKNRIIDHYSSI